MLTLVTGTNHQYFLHLRQLLDNITAVCNNTDIPTRIVVYDLGMTDQERGFLETHYMDSEIDVVKFNFAMYPDHVSLDKYYGYNCTYAWKGVLFHEVCEKYGGHVYWVDTRNRLDGVNKVVDILKRVGIYCPVSCGLVGQWTHKTTIKNMEAYCHLNNICRNGAIIGINYDNDWCRSLIKDWKDTCLDKECIAPSGSNRSNHRQDQAILTILYYKYQCMYNFEMVDHCVDVHVHNKLRPEYAELPHNNSMSLDK